MQPNFVERVIADIEKGNYYTTWRKYKWKPRWDETIYSDDSGYSAWNVSIHLGLISWYVVLNRDGWEPIKMTRREKNRLWKAHKKAMRHELQQYNRHMERLRK